MCLVCWAVHDGSELWVWITVEKEGRGRNGPDWREWNVVDIDDVKLEVQRWNRRVREERRGDVRMGDWIIESG